MPKILPQMMLYLCDATNHPAIFPGTKAVGVSTQRAFASRFPVCEPSWNISDMTITSATHFLAHGTIDTNVAKVIRDSRAYWNESPNVRIERTNLAPVSTHPNLSSDKSALASAVAATSKYADEKTPHASVITHYEGKFAMFDESVLVPPSFLADKFHVKVADLPYTCMVAEKSNPMVMDIVHFRKEGDRRAPEQKAIFDLDLEGSDNLDASGYLQIALDNYHKNYHFIHDTFGIDINHQSNFEGVYIEKNADETWEAVRYQRPASFATDAGLNVDDRKRKRRSIEEFSAAEKPSTKRTKDDSPSEDHAAVLKTTSFDEPMTNNYTGKEERLDAATREVLYTFTSESEARQTHRKFMDIAVVLSGAELPAA
jgi:hypothetical protein